MTMFLKEDFISKYCICLAGSEVTVFNKSHGNTLLVKDNDGKTFAVNVDDLTENKPPVRVLKKIK